MEEHLPIFSDAGLPLGPQTALDPMCHLFLNFKIPELRGRKNYGPENTS